MVREGPVHWWQNGCQVPFLKRVRHSQEGVRWFTLTAYKAFFIWCKSEESINDSNLKIIQENWQYVLWRGASTPGQILKPIRITQHKELHSKAWITNTKGLSNRILWDFHSHCNQEGGSVIKFRGSGSWKLEVGKNRKERKWNFLRWGSIAWSSLLHRLLWGQNELVHRKHLAQCLAQFYL